MYFIYHKYRFELFYIIKIYSYGIFLIFGRTRNPSKYTMMALGISNVFFMLPWQFAQFVLLTQVSDLKK